jgi:hypothetical protein
MISYIVSNTYGDMDALSGWLKTTSVFVKQQAGRYLWPLTVPVALSTDPVGL